MARAAAADDGNTWCVSTGEERGTDGDGITGAGVNEGDTRGIEGKTLHQLRDYICGRVNEMFRHDEKIDGWGREGDADSVSCVCVQGGGVVLMAEEHILSTFCTCLANASEEKSGQTLGDDR